MNLAGAVHINKKGLFILLFFGLIVFYYLFSYKTSSDEDFKINLRKLLAVAIKAAENGGKEVVKNQNDLLVIKSKGKTKEGADDSVTTADFKSHCVMLDSLKRSFPTVTIISEESKVQCDQNYDYDQEVLNSNLTDEWVNEKDVTIWIDPLDATQEYTEKLNDYVTTMVCVAVKGEPVIGVIHKPFNHHTFWAWNGKGHSFKLIGSKENTGKTKFIVSRSHSGKVKEVVKEKFDHEQFKIISAGGAGYKVLQLVNGMADIYIHITAIKKWDVCAGNAILNTLGGQMVTKDKGSINYGDPQDVLNENGLIATLTNKEIFNVKF